MESATPTEQEPLPAPLLVRIGNWLFRSRNVVLPLLLIALLVGFRPVPFRGDPRLDPWLDAAGILLAIIGQTLRATTIGYKYIIRGGKNRRVYAEDLVTAGMFSHARNPLYVGNLLVLFGLLVIHNNPWVYLLGIPLFVFFYVSIVAAEEAYLRQKFGVAYDDYCRDVPRWVPRLKGFRQSVREIPFNWEEVVYTEFGSTYTWVLAALALIAYEVVSAASPARRAFDQEVFVALFILLTFIWAGWRYWKKWLTARVRRAAAERMQSEQPG